MRIDTLQKPTTTTNTKHLPPLLSHVSSDKPQHMQPTIMANRILSFSVSLLQSQLRPLTLTATSHCRNLSSSSTSTPRPLTAGERDFLDRAIRVNQAGELGANVIYAGQYAVFKNDARLRPLIRHMWDQEVHHLNTFNRLVAKHRVRPTAMQPLWNVAGYVLGVGTALMGEKAAMVCTEAVETEIGGHYNDQIRDLLNILKDDKELLQSGELKELIETIRQFRDDELEHLDTAVAHDAKGANGYEVLFNVIRGGCKAAIWISSRV